MLATRHMLYIALGLIVIGFIGFVWNVLNLQGARNRGRHRQSGSGRREVDRKPLSRHERRLMREAERLMRAGNVQAAAQILESMGMMREAITALEMSGHINEAAKVLMRMQRPGRAGVVYARHNMWDKAMQCFKTADMPLEAAKCAREMGDHAMAAELFEKAGRNESAAESFESAGNLLRSGQLYVAAGKAERAMIAFAKHVQIARNVAAINFADADLAAIVAHLASGATDEPLIEVAVHRNKLIDVIQSLIATNRVNQAAALIPRATVDIGPQLMAGVSYQDGSSGRLAEAFGQAGLPKYAGMVLEQMSAFDRAGECFAQAGEQERAAYCFERAGLMDRARQVREQANVSHAPVADDGEERTSVVASAAPPPAAPASGDAPTIGTTKTRSVISLSLADDTPPPVITPASSPRPVVTPPPPPPPPPPSIVPSAAPRPAPIPIAINIGAPDEDRMAFDALPCCAELTADQRQSLWSIGTVTTAAPGITVYGDGSGSPSLFVLLQGHARVTYESDALTPKQVASGHIIGAGWFLESPIVPLRVEAEGSCRFFTVPKDTLERLMDRDGALARRLYKELTRAMAL